MEIQSDQTSAFIFEKFGRDIEVVKKDGEEDFRIWNANLLTRNHGIKWPVTHKGHIFQH